MKRVLIAGKNQSELKNTLGLHSLRSILTQRGYSIVAEFSQKPDVVLFIDYEPAIHGILRRARRFAIRTVLIANEPSVVIPEHGQARILRKFDRVIFVGRPGGEIQLKWPQAWRTLANNPRKMDRVVLINADKWSFISGHCYWLRAALVTSDAPIDVFGHGWGRGASVRFAHRIFELLRTLAAGEFPTFKGLRFLIAKPKFYKGLVEDKISEMSKYKVALVIENSLELMTEKLFDAWFAGCIPVYVGPDIKRFGLPEDLVVWSEPNIASIKKAIAYALGLDTSKFEDSLSAFLKSPEASKWKSHAALNAVLEAALAPSTAS